MYEKWLGMLWFYVIFIWKKKEKLIKFLYFRIDILKRFRNWFEDVDIVLFIVCLINLFLNVCFGGL